MTRAGTYDQVFRAAGPEAHGEHVVPYDVVGDGDANDSPHDGELGADAPAQVRRDYRQEHPRVVADQVVEANNEGGADQAHDKAHDARAAHADVREDRS